MTCFNSYMHFALLKEVKEKFVVKFHNRLSGEFVFFHSDGTVTSSYEDLPDYFILDSITKDPKEVKINIFACASEKEKGVKNLCRSALAGNIVYLSPWSLIEVQTVFGTSTQVSVLYDLFGGSIRRINYTFEKNKNFVTDLSVFDIKSKYPVLSKSLKEYCKKMNSLNTIKDVNFESVLTIMEESLFPQSNDNDLREVESFMVHIHHIEGSLRYR